MPHVIPITLTASGQHAVRRAPSLGGRARRRVARDVERRDAAAAKADGLAARARHE